MFKIQCKFEISILPKTTFNYEYIYITQKIKYSFLTQNFLKLDFLHNKIQTLTIYELTNSSTNLTKTKNF